MSGGEKKWVIKKLCWQRVVENWDTCTKKKKILYNIFTILSPQVLSFRLLWVFIGRAKKVILVVGSN